MRTSWLLPLASLALAASCIGDQDEGPFTDDGNPDDSVGVDGGGKADSTAHGYRDGCEPLRTGKYALQGDIVTPTGTIGNGYLVVDGDKISAILTHTLKPSGMPIVVTGGIIFPGLIDGHSHVEYNHIPLADFGKRYQDRDQWPNAQLYQTLVKDPKNAVTAAGLTCEALKHGETRALVGGTTAIQGTPQMQCIAPLVRNLEQTNFCRDRVRQNVLDASDFNRGISGKPSFAQSIKTDLAANNLDAFVLHLGEGIDAHAESEWGIIKADGLAVSQLVVIHGAAFTQSDFTELAQVGGKLIWSPLSNLLLYGATANIPEAIAAGVSVSLGSDWAPSGSANLLGELKVADHVNQALWKGILTDQQLVEMVTINPAKAFGMQNELGTLEVGKYADLLVVAKRKGVTAPRTLIEARPQDVLLVTISGDPLVGTPASLETLGKTGDYETIDACGTPLGVDVTVVSTHVPKGTETLSTIESSLLAVNPKLTPVIDCTDTSMRAAFMGTPMQLP